MLLLGASHGPLLLEVDVGIPALILPAINNLKVDVIIPTLGFDGDASAIGKRCRVVRQEERLLSQQRSLPNVSTIHVIICLW
jgi:hypothetical protein